MHKNNCCTNYTNCEDLRKKVLIHNFNNNNDCLFSEFIFDMGTNPAPPWTLASGEQLTVADLEEVEVDLLRVGVLLLVDTHEEVLDVHDDAEQAVQLRLLSVLQMRHVACWEGKCVHASVRVLRRMLVWKMICRPILKMITQFWKMITRFWRMITRF